MLVILHINPLGRLWIIRIGIDVGFVQWPGYVSLIHDHFLIGSLGKQRVIISEQTLGYQPTGHCCLLQLLSSELLLAVTLSHSHLCIRVRSLAVC